MKVLKLLVFDFVFKYKNIKIFKFFRELKILLWNSYILKLFGEE